MCHDGLRIYGEELGETRDCITTDFRCVVFDEFNPLGDEVVKGPASLNFNIKLAGKVFTGSGEDDEGALCAIEMSNA